MSRTVTEPTTIRHQVGTCPACRCGLWAEVRVVTVVHPPMLTAKGEVLPNAAARPVSMSLNHHCAYNEDDGEWISGSKCELGHDGCACAESEEAS